MIKFELITNQNKDYYRYNFINWMKHNYSEIQHPNIIFSNIMLSIKNDIGFSINDLVLKHISIDEYQRKYAEYFQKINRKSPAGHASVHKWNAKFFLEYVYSSYQI